MARYRTTEDKYQIKFPCGIWLASNIPYLGYTLATLKDMEKHGYYLYKNGKRLKLTGLTDAEVKKAWCV